MKRLRIREEARAEFLHETGYYAAKSEAAGRCFREAVNASMGLIRRFPSGGAPGPANTRRTKVKGFPFTIVYRDDLAEIVVFAIAPDRRQPGYWLLRTSTS
ncbi:type II toxin-antitoxin system RelE/ParE family toxin [Paucibacter sp. XJ19-41]|uniref:type II toxin-antitoxin system RelE/ParE family toxin n=1 Tax=Paucibacter sp. XJ19-41 TaxID=2927824 RepID=UPI00234B7464|nr:type II toxin-antitoxin system RelE/ParE family toxin [Paucibacter sp. XJ19-41]MDC6167732.1 type II toxin-antitoxin system RelE/ParE family toxin [Paucibacter sp. XJ19-41]